MKDLIFTPFAFPNLRSQAWVLARRLLPQRTKGTHSMGEFDFFLCGVDATSFDLSTTKLIKTIDKAVTYKFVDTVTYMYMYVVPLGGSHVCWSSSDVCKSKLKK